MWLLLSSSWLYIIEFMWLLHSKVLLITNNMAKGRFCDLDELLNTRTHVFYPALLLRWWGASSRLLLVYLHQPITNMFRNWLNEIKGKKAKTRIRNEV